MIRGSSSENIGNRKMILNHTEILPIEPMIIKNNELYVDYQPQATENRAMLRDMRITNNEQYRQYMIHNASNIQRMNMTRAINFNEYNLNH